jgi:hypothetical protein
MLVPGLEVREGRNVEGKRRIACATLVEVPQSGSLIIDSGSTALHLADMLDRDRDLTAITDHVPIGCVAPGDGFAGPALGVGHRSRVSPARCVSEPLVGSRTASASHYTDFT